VANLSLLTVFTDFLKKLPVIVAGNKLDLFRPSSTAGMTDEQALARSRQQIVSLMQRFRFVRQCIKCSAKNLLRVDEVFLKAQQGVLYPFTPLYDLDNGRITADLRRAFTRIFRMYDADNDGLLSDAELDRFHREAFHTPVIDRDFAAWKKVVSRNNPTEEEVVREGKFTVAGFLAIFDVFIAQNRLDVVWQALRKFGYDDDLRLHIPETVTAPSDDKMAKDWRLTRGARNFLSDVFHQFDADHDGYISGDDLLAIFSILPEPSLPPWHPRRAPEVFKDCSAMPKIPLAGSRPDSPGSGNGEPVALAMSQSLSASGITILSSESLPTVTMGSLHTLSAPLSFLDWMGFWHTMSSISPAVTRAELFRLGHIEKPGKKDPRRRSRKGGAVSPDNRTPDSRLPSREIRVLVLGNPTSGRTDLVNALCGLDGVDSSAYLRVKDPASKTYPETSSAHIKMRRKKASAKASKGDDGEEFVLHLVFTEFLQMDPAKNSDHQRELSEYLGDANDRQCDLVMLVFDSTDDASLTYVRDIEASLLGEDLPRVYVGTQTETEDSNNDDDSVQPATVMDNAIIHCREIDLEPPLLTAGESMLPAAGQPGVRERNKVLDHLARCARMNEQGVQPLRSKPHEEQKRREAARRRKLIWFGGLVSVSVVVAAGVGLLLGTAVKGERKDRLGWFTRILFGESGGRATATK
jgi:Ras family protein T1